MNWRALGCGLLAAVAFVAVGSWGLLLAMGPAGCPPSLQWADRTYLASGAPSRQPIIGEGVAVRLGTTLVGALSREVYGPAGSSPSPSGADRPEQVALDCGDGTFVTYRFTSVLPTLTPGP